jgi:hypothetical protein
MIFYGKIIHKRWDFPAIPAGLVPYLSSGPPSGGVSLSLAGSKLWLIFREHYGI